MAGVAKSWYVTVIDLGEGGDKKKIRTVFTKKCLTVGEANTVLKQKKEEYPDTKRYTVTKENY